MVINHRWFVIIVVNFIKYYSFVNINIVTVVIIIIFIFIIINYYSLIIAIIRNHES